MSDLKSAINSYDRKSLAELVNKHGGVSLTLDGVKCELKHKLHFHIDARDMM